MWLMNIKNIDKEKKDLLLLTLFILIVSCGCLIYPEIPFGHDGRFHLSRISSLRDAILLGYDFPVKIYPNYFNGIGYGNGLFYPDLFLYIPAYISTLGINVITSYKITLVLCSIFTILFMYKCSKAITNSHYAAYISTLIYTLSGYRLCNMYDRGAIGELLAMCFIPLSFYGFYHIMWRDKNKCLFFIIGFTGLLMSHIISSVLYIIFLVILFIIQTPYLFKNIYRLKPLLFSLFLILLLVSYFYIPMIEQLYLDKFILNTQTITNDLAASTVQLYKLFLDFPLHFIPKLNLGGISGIGILALISIFLYSKNIKSYKKDNIVIFKLFGVAIVITIFICNFFPWNTVLKIIPWFSAIQFPWRFYVISVFLFSIIGGYIYNSYFTSKTIYKYLFVAYALIGFINIAPPYLITIHLQNKGIPVLFDRYFVGNAEYIPAETTKKELWNNDLRVKSNNKTIKIESHFVGDKYIIHYTDNNIDSTFIELPLLYYKGYVAIEDDKHKISISKSKKGLININLNPEKEEGIIYVLYEGTKIQKIFNWVSICTFCGLIIYLYIFTYREKKNY